MSLIKCKECGREISSQATSCPNCGCPVTPPLQNTPLQSNPSAIVYPQTSKKKTSNSITVIFAVLIFVSILVFIISNIMKNPEAYKKQSIIEKEMKLTKEQEEKALEIFEQCGIGEISKIKTFQSGEAHTSYYVTDNEVSEIVVWVTSEGEIESIYFGDNDIFVDGEFIAPITNFYVNSKEQDIYRTITQTEIKKLLNDPDTAQFRGISAWNFKVEDGIVIVQSSVTAQNSFGVKDTIDFQLKFDNKEIISLIMGDTEYIN